MKGTQAMVRGSRPVAGKLGERGNSNSQHARKQAHKLWTRVLGVPGSPHLVAAIPRRPVYDTQKRRLPMQTLKGESERCVGAAPYHTKQDEAHRMVRMCDLKRADCSYRLA